MNKKNISVWKICIEGVSIGERYRGGDKRRGDERQETENPLICRARTKRERACPSNEVLVSRERERVEGKYFEKESLGPCY